MNVPHAADNTKLAALRKAARQFCDESGIWRETYSDFSVAGETDYPLAHGYDNVLIKRVERVRVNGFVVRNNLWAINRDGELIFDNAFTEDDVAIEVDLVLVPTEFCVITTDWLANRWGNAIVQCAMANLKKDPGGGKSPAPWYDPNSAIVALAEYQDELYRAKREVINSQQGGTLGAVGPFFMG